jgi:hypothetical protein
MNSSVPFGDASEGHRDAAAHPAALRWPIDDFFVDLRKLVGVIMSTDGDQLFVVASNPF